MSFKEFQLRDEKLTRDIYGSDDAVAFYTRLLKLCLAESQKYVEIMQR